MRVALRITDNTRFGYHRGEVGNGEHVGSQCPSRMSIRPIVSAGTEMRRDERIALAALESVEG